MINAATIRLVLPLLVCVAVMTHDVYANSVPEYRGAASLEWTDAPRSLPAEARMAVLEGNPAGPGLYTVRLHVPAGTSFDAHWHPFDVRVTVLSGALDVWHGPEGKEESPRRLSAGDFLILPERARHRAWFASETVLQLSGVGPWETNVAESAVRVAAKGELRVVSVKPAEGSVLRDDDEIEIEVEYSVEPFRPSMYRLFLVFESTVENQWMGVPLAVAANEAPTPPQKDLLTEARGRRILRARPSEVFRLGFGALAKPVRVRVLLNEMTATDRSRSLADTNPIAFAE